ncbi:MAG: pantoate--beta-alanine ligase [Chitinophagaceae bacterium]|nr:pantoate--beta-alanine ligase [Chitinophagaceae bacterium]
MILFKRASELHRYIEEQHKNELQAGFVPTMGALHAGHLSLIERSISENDITICSIFVNPAQFNDPDDFKKYPVTTEKDIDALERSGCGILFLPPAEEIYPDETYKKETYNIGHLETILEGKFRPGHFQGVCMVVSRLLKIVSPDNLYLGQKDYQQCMVLQKLIELMGAEKRIKLKICPTLREPGGLAMSSRNMRLDQKERENAIAIYDSLMYIKNHISQKTIRDLKAETSEILTNKKFHIDYVEIADAISLEPVDTWDEKRKIVALIAAFMGKVRLIDNMMIQ